MMNVKWHPKDTLIILNLIHRVHVSSAAGLDRLKLTPIASCSFVTMCPNKWVNAQLVILLAMSPILRFLPSVLSVSFPKKSSISFSES